MTVATEWDGRLADLVAHPPLLQSWAWGEVQLRAGWHVERLQLETGLATVLIGGRVLRHAYVPRGPVPPEPRAVEELIAWARRNRIARLRVEPEAGPDLADSLTALALHAEPDARLQQPAHTAVVRLAASPDQVLGGFKPKTRYNIRLAERRGVEVTTGADAEELERQAAATAGRQGIRLPGAGYYRVLLEQLPWCRTYVARHEGEPLAAILVARHAGRAYYLYGGSNGRKRELMPMYAAQWEAMRSAAEDGLADYDLWGIPPPDQPDHPWQGLLQFKAGFNGRQVEYCGVWEADLSPGRAALLRFGESIRAARRRAPRIL